MRVEELISRYVVLRELNADIGISQTSGNLVPTPRSGEMVPQPGGETMEHGLLEASSGDIVGSIGSSNDERKEEDEKEKSDEDGHATKVKGQEALLVPVSSDKASQRDEEYEEAKDEDVPPEVVDALVVWFGGQPYS